MYHSYIYTILLKLSKTCKFASYLKIHAMIFKQYENFHKIQITIILDKV